MQWISYLWCVRLYAAPQLWGYQQLTELPDFVCTRRGDACATLLSGLQSLSEHSLQPGFWQPQLHGAVRRRAAFDSTQKLGI